MKDRSLAIVSGLLFAAFVLIAVAVKVSPDLQKADLQVALWVNHLNIGDLLNSLMIAASQYGREYFWVGVVGLMFLFGDRRTKVLALGLCGVFIVGIAAGEVLKDVIARARPAPAPIHIGYVPPDFVFRMPLDTDYSFPSGHALIVSIGAFFSLATFRKKWVAGLLTLEAAIVSFSRVYTFEHYPTDVIAGVILGASTALFGLVIGRRYLRRYAEAVTAYLVKLLRQGPLKL